MTLAVSDALRGALPFASVAVCLLAVPLIVLARRRPNLREGVSLAAALVNFGLVLWIYRLHRAGVELRVDVLDAGGPLRVAFRADDLGVLFALVASSLWIVNTLYSIGYMRAHHEERQTRFYGCFAIALAAAMGAAFAANLFTLFACYEVLTISTFPLVVHAGTERAKAGARRYLTYLLGASLVFFLPAVLVCASLADSLDFAPGGFLAATAASPALLSLLFVLFLAGIAKSALMPLHAWLPAAMVAPTPVSALLHAVAVVKTGVFAVSRIVFHVFGTDLLGDLGIHHVLVWAAATTILVASLVALAQDDLKRRLAYSTVGQLSYVLLGVGLLVPAAAVGGLTHIGVHAVSKITLFFAAGAIFVAHHRTKVSELDGIGRRMPVTMVAFAVGAFSLIGVPPAAGVVSKWWLVQGTAAAPSAQGVALLVVLGASAILNAAYFLPIVWRAFFRPAAPGHEGGGVAEAPWPCTTALALTAAGTVVLFFFPDVLLDLAGAVASSGSAP